MRYAKQYASTLSPIGDKVSNELLQLSPDKRIHAMKALSCLAKFTGKYEQWQQIRRRYNLTWNIGNESLLLLLSTSLMTRRLGHNAGLNEGSD
jgi:hypothetical protein